MDSASDTPSAGQRAQKIQRRWTNVSLMVLAAAVAGIAMGGAWGGLGAEFVTLFPWILGLGGSVAWLVVFSTKQQRPAEHDLRASTRGALATLVLGLLGVMLWRGARGHMLPFAPAVHGIVGALCVVAALALFAVQRRARARPVPTEPPLPSEPARARSLPVALTLAVLFTVALPKFSGGRTDSHHVMEMRSVLERVIVAQQDYWRQHGRLASGIDALAEVSVPAEISISTDSTEFSWLALARHTRTDRLECSVEITYPSPPTDTLPPTGFVDCRPPR